MVSPLKLNTATLLMKTVYPDTKSHLFREDFSQIYGDTASKLIQFEAAQSLYIISD